MGKKKAKEPEPPAKDEFDPLQIVSKNPGTVVLMLDSPEEAVLQSACEALYTFAEKCKREITKKYKRTVLIASRLNFSATHESFTNSGRSRGRAIEETREVQGGEG